MNIQEIYNKNKSLYSVLIHEDYLQNLNQLNGLVANIQLDESMEEPLAISFGAVKDLNLNEKELVKQFSSFEFDARDTFYQQLKQVISEGIPRTKEAYESLIDMQKHIVSVWAKAYSWLADPVEVKVYLEQNIFTNKKIIKDLMNLDHNKIIQHIYKKYVAQALVNPIFLKTPNKTWGMKELYKTDEIAATIARTEIRNHIYSVFNLPLEDGQALCLKKDGDDALLAFGIGDNADEQVTILKKALYSSPPGLVRTIKGIKFKFKGLDGLESQQEVKLNIIIGTKDSSPVSIKIKTNIIILRMFVDFPLG
jgi:hypothetical protein